MKKLLKTGLSTAIMAGTLFAGFPGNYASTNGGDLLHKSPSTDLSFLWFTRPIGSK